jgi:hypothetical protein
VKAAKPNHEAGDKRSGFCVFDYSPEPPFVDGVIRVWDEFYRTRFREYAESLVFMRLRDR